MKLNSVNQLKTTLLAICRQPGKIAILTHMNPDGDGLAAALALKEILNHSGFQSDIVLEKTAPDFLDFLQVKSKTLVYDPHMKYQIIILLDCHTPDRTGDCAALATKASTLIAIDHHNYSDQELDSHWYYFIKPEDVSTGATIYNTFAQDISKMPPEQKLYVADCLYTTILNDTDGFINNNVNSEVFRVCAGICTLGTSPAIVTEKFLLNNSPQKLRLIGNALASIEVHHNSRILFMHTTLKNLQDNDLNQDATSNISKWAKGASGCDVLIYAREIEENVFRLSLRSPQINCQEICSIFGGGGHSSAAGCRIALPLSQMRDTILKEVIKHLQ